MASVRIRYWAAARAAAGAAEETVEADDCDVALREALDAHDDPELTRVVASASFLVDGVRRRRDELVGVAAPATLEVLPPFAGG
ncbi:MoaD/ThiS family protein [Propionibacteriaceae bacterium Y2011]